MVYGGSVPSMPLLLSHKFMLNIIWEIKVLFWCGFEVFLGQDFTLGCVNMQSSANETTTSGETHASRPPCLRRKGASNRMNSEPSSIRISIEKSQRFGRFRGGCYEEDID